MKRLFHYSKACHLASICNEGTIRLATAGVIYDRPAVWASTREDFEPTSAVGKLVGGRLAPMSRDEMAAQPLFNPIRIEIKPDACPFDWGAFKQLSKIRPKLAHALEIIGREQGANPKHWYAGFVPIAADDWLTISYYFKGEWLVVPVEPAIIRMLASISVSELESFFVEHGAKVNLSPTMQPLVA